MTESMKRFAQRAVRRKRLFLALSIAGVGIAAGLGLFYGYRRWSDPAFPIGARAVLLVLILLNARQNLRQYRYAELLEELLPDGPQKTLV